MSEENVELARRVMDALSRRDLSRVIALADPAIEWHSFFAELGDEGVYRGHDGMRQYMRDLNDAWEVVRADVDDTVGVGDVAVLIGHIHYRGRHSGIETETPAGWMLKFRHGRVVCIRAFREPEQALEGLGLAGQATPANLDLVRSIYTAWERGDFSSAEWAHPEIEYVVVGERDFQSVSAKGLTEMREAARSRIEVWEQQRIEPDEYRELDGGRVLVLDRYRGRGKKSGLEMEQLGRKGVHLFHLHGGKVTRLVAYGDRKRAFADLGLEG